MSEIITFKKSDVDILSKAIKDQSAEIDRLQAENAKLKIQCENCGYDVEKKELLAETLLYRQAINKIGYKINEALDPSETPEMGDSIKSA